MVRGYQRRMVFLKNTGSKIFDEAYFVLSEEASALSVGKDDMIEEAKRIVEENLINRDTGSHRGARGVFVTLFKRLPFVFIGVLIGVGVTLLVL